MEHRRFGFIEENLLSPADAIAAFFAAVSIVLPAVERVALERAHGRVLGAHVVADRDYPDAARSAMDGFAIRACPAHTRLAIAGEVEMGSVWSGALPHGSALRVPTGGVIPDGADAVVPIEDAIVDGESVSIETPTGAGENITPQGSDMRADERVLATGTRIGAPELGVLATLGVTRVPVFERPLVAVISSGDELVSPRAQPRPGQVRDSNRYAIAAALTAMGCEIVHVPTVADRPGALEAALGGALAACDAVVVTGGSSVGERDRTPDAIASLGEPGVIVHGLRVKPGKPTVLAALGRKPILGLPGNPTSALMILEAVAGPIVAALAGTTERIDSVVAILDAPAKSREGWTWYVPVELRDEGNTPVAHPLALRSSMVSLAARAHGYVTIPQDDGEIPAWTRVSVRRFL